MTKGRYPRNFVIAPRVIAAAAIVVAAVPSPSAAQQTRSASGVTAIAPGGDLESYLRYLQSTGNVRLLSWGIRESSIRKSDKLVPAAPHPWDARIKPGIGARPWLESTIIPLEISARANSAFPFGSNDGAVWAGRGLTLAGSAGGTLRAGPFVAQLNPIVFWAQNAAFDLQLNGQTGIGIYRERQPQYAASIDLPQRFGAASYARADLGESELRLELPWFMTGVSNAHRIWGPAAEYPFILGRNAAGFPHAFVSTSDPLNLGFARLNANVLWGFLSQSAYSPVQGSAAYSSFGEPGTRRFATGIALSFEPRGVPGLEFGVTRFIHSVWPKQGLPRTYFGKAFQNFLKKSVQEATGPDADGLESGDNQLLSIFSRWVLPHSGAEIYFEYGRDDHAYDFRDLVNEPDHARSYMLGGRKIIRSDGRHMSAFRAEMINFQLPTTVRHRDEGGIYLHTSIRQGHTQRGQLLGAPAGVGAAAASMLAYDRFDPLGRLTISWTRTVNQEAGAFQKFGVQSSSAIDVTHSLAAERMMFRGPVDVTIGVAVAREFNRNFASDAFNASAMVGARYNLR